MDDDDLGDEEPIEDEAGDEVGDDEDEEEGHRRIPLLVKVGMVGGLWLLLVVFLVGRWSDDGDDPIRLDQAADSDQPTELEATLEEVDGGDGSAAAADGGSGSLEPGERGTVSPAGASTGSGATAVGGSGTRSTTTTAGDGETSPDERPVGTTSTTARSGSGGGGGSSTTTTTVKSGGGGGGGSTSTTTTTTLPPSSYAATIEVDDPSSGSASEFSKTSVTIAEGESVRFVNKDNFPHTLTINGTTLFVLQANETRLRRFDDKGTFHITCATPGHHGDVNVVVT